MGEKRGRNGRPGRQDVYKPYQIDGAVNRPKPDTVNTNEIDRLTNLSEDVDQTKNPATSAKVNGAKLDKKAPNFPEFDSPKWAGAPAIILRHFCGVAA